MSDEEPVLSGYPQSMVSHNQKGSLASKITGATGGKTKAAKDAARKEAHERGVATRAATMRKRTLPDGSDADRAATRALPEEDGRPEELDECSVDSEVRLTCSPTLHPRST